MWAGRPRTWLGLLVLVAACGCEQMETLRQGAGSTYKIELRQLAEEISRKEVANLAANKEWKQELHQDPVPDAANAAAALWHPAPLLDAVHLSRPVPLNTDWAPQD
jgi:hypothetical protein